MCDGSRTFTAIVRDAVGQTAMDTADLYCQLPAPGSEEYTRTYPGASGSGGAAIASLPDGSAIVAGVLDGRMALWRLDPEGNVAAGWPKTLAGWTEDLALAAKESNATAVGIDSTGAIFIAGTTVNGLATRRYLAKLSGQGERLWEDAGIKDGEEISSLAISAADDAVAAGSVRTSPIDQPAAYDWGTWGYPRQGPRWSDTFMQPDTDPQPDQFNTRSERAHAVPELPELLDMVVESADSIAGPTPKLVAVLSAGPQDRTGSTARRTMVRIAEMLRPARTTCPRLQRP